MNIIELTKLLLQEFPKINQVCNDIHVDFTTDVPTSYGLSPTGDTLLSEDILGNQLRQHNFTLYAVYPSMSDYDRLANSGTLLELQLWLERKAQQQPVTVTIDNKNYTGALEKITCANGMLYSVSQENMLDGVTYQLQISVQYIIET